MYDYKCSNSRLARFFKDSRDKWKLRAEKYQGTIRSLKVKVRDLKNSRDHWKIQARLAEEERYAIEREYHNLLPQDQNDKKGGDSSPAGPEVESANPGDTYVKKGECIPRLRLFVRRRANASNRGPMENARQLSSSINEATC